jgi:hypothetical protein
MLQCINEKERGPQDVRRSKESPGVGARISM